MKPIGSLQSASENILKEAKSLLMTLRQHTESTPEDIVEAIRILEDIRNDVYEDLNQLQHEYLTLKAVEWLQSQYPFPNEAIFYWNPRQTGDETEPDIALEHRGNRLISAEVTTSKIPMGLINSRIATTLEKLNQMPGKKFYFVRSDKMHKRAKTKVERSKFDIQVVNLIDK